MKHPIRMELAVLLCLILAFAGPAIAQSQQSQPAAVLAFSGTESSLWVVSLTADGNVLQPPTLVSEGFYGQGDAALLRPEWAGGWLYYSAAPDMAERSIQRIRSLGRLQVDQTGTIAAENILTLESEPDRYEALKIAAASPDGRYLWVVRYTESASLLVDTQAPADQRVVYTLPVCGSEVAAWTAEFLFTRNTLCPFDLAVRDPRTGQPRLTLPEDTAPANQWTFVAGAQPYLIGTGYSNDSPIYRLDPQTGDVLKIGAGADMAASSRGGFLVYTSEFGDLWRVGLNEIQGERISVAAALSPFWETRDGLAALRTEITPKGARAFVVRVTRKDFTEKLLLDTPAEQIAPVQGWPVVALRDKGTLWMQNEKGLLWENYLTSATPAEKPFGDGATLPTYGGRWVMIRLKGVDNPNNAANVAVNVETGQAIPIEGELVSASPDGQWVISAVVNGDTPDRLYGYHVRYKTPITLYEGVLGQRNFHFDPRQYYVWRPMSR